VLEGDPEDLLEAAGLRSAVLVVDVQGVGLELDADTERLCGTRKELTHLGRPGRATTHRYTPIELIGCTLIRAWDISLDPHHPNASAGTGMGAIRSFAGQYLPVLAFSRMLASPKSQTATGCEAEAFHLIRAHLRYFNPAEVFDRGTLGEGMRAAIEQVERGYEEMIDGWHGA
jgi:hypothetical protein